MSYGHGGDIYQNRPVTLDFSINVNPLGMPDFVKKAAMESLEESFRYPDSRCGRLRSAAAAHSGVSEAGLIFGNGAAELLFRLVLVKRPKRAVLLAPSFSEYEAALKTVGAKIHFFYLKEEASFGLPVSEYLDFLEKQKPDMIFLCNPANPTGAVLERAAMDRILAFCESRGIFAVVDECFMDFLEKPEDRSSMPWIREGKGENLFLLQAFTKSFAMAGLRAGYGFSGDEGLLRRMEESWQPWSVSIPAQAAALSTFGKEREPFLRETRTLLKEERPLLSEGLQSLGFTVFPSAANFLLFKDGKPEAESRLYEYCLEHGVLIRACGNYEGLDKRFYRVCIRGHEDNDYLLNIMNGYL